MKIQLDKHAWTFVGHLPGADRGGFGEVYEVQSEAVPTAAAKTVPQVPGARREILMADSVDAGAYPNVVPILDTGEHKGHWVLVMPRAEKSLKRHIEDQGGPLPLDEVVAILRDIATALDAIEGKIVHRDIKPGNVLLLDGAWCLADFGIARYTDATTDTETRKLSKSKDYAAPEQWRDERATAATDIYGFGVIAYELLTGERPFRGVDAAELRDQHLTKKAPALTVGTRRLRVLVEECLYKAPEARPTAAAVLERLTTAAEESSEAGASKLGRVNQVVVQAEADRHTEKVAEAEETDRRDQLFAAALQSFSTFPEELLQVIRNEAPAAAIAARSSQNDQGMKVSLKGASLEISHPSPVGSWGGPFTVIAAAEIVVSREHRDTYGWLGRSHSLWFCDPYEKGRFAWYELAFMSGPFGGGPAEEPYALRPSGGTAAQVFTNVIGSIQLGWPVEELDRAEPSEFVDRWIGWFADAAAGALSRPSTMPEKRQVKNFRIA